ncbi:hypothetical protein [Kutzneria sp. NPDC051319]|uniref:hypothetical protein n=1 Tax=Kutzneria sp. NPDC051319 TaxID=3155047 RepID=UPI003421EB26
MKNTIVKIATSAAVVIAAAVVLPASAEAATQSAPNCQFGNTYGVRVDHAKVVADNGVSVGEIQLCRDSDYKFWGFLLLNQPLNASTYGDAVMERDRDGLPEFVGCESAGGNGIVLPNQTRCWTPKLTGLSGAYSFRAEGSTTSSHTGTTLTYGSTGTTR